MAMTRYPVSKKTLILQNGTGNRYPSAGNQMYLEMTDGSLEEFGILAGTSVIVKNVQALNCDSADYANLAVLNINVETAFFLS